MVAIIDDREDMWARCPNLVHVKPYVFFGSTGDIHAPERFALQPAHGEIPPSLPVHFTPPMITPPHVLSRSPPLDSKTDADPPTESDSGEIALDSNFENISFSTDLVVPVPEPTESIVPVPESIVPVPDPIVPVPESIVPDPIVPVSDSIVPVPEQEQVEPVILESEATSVAESTNENTEPMNEQLIPPLSSSSDSSDSSESSNTPSSPPAEGERPDTNPSPPVPPKEKSVSEINDKDKFLLYLITTLTKVHTMFYDKYAEIQADHGLSPTKEQQLVTPDLKEIIPRLRHSVLKGACLLFTGVIPTNRNPQEDPTWNTARAFGAAIHDRIYTSQDITGKITPTTHVIATKPGTNKYREAMRVPGIRIVTPKWLWACAESWQWIDEKDYPVKVRRSSKDKLGQSHKKQHLSTEGEKEIDYAPFPEIGDFENATSSIQMDTIEPLLTPLDLDLTKLSEDSERVFTPDRKSFSLEDINAMNEEVNLAIYNCTSSSSDNELQDYPEGSAPKSRKRKRPFKSEPTTDNTTETGSSSDREEPAGNFDDMAALLEREFEADIV